MKRGVLSEYEEKLIIDLHAQLGNKWSKIASHMPGRTDNEIKNLWHTHIKKKLSKMGIDPLTHKPIHPDPPTDNHQNNDGQESEQSREEEMKEQDKGHEENGGISLLEESIISNNEDHLNKEKAAMSTSNVFSIHEVPLIEPHEFFVPDSDQQSSCFSTTSALTTISMSSIDSFFEDLKSLPSSEDRQSDDNSKNYDIGTMGVPDDEFIDWDWLFNEFDIDKIDHDIIQSLPNPTTAQEWS